jgi:hypothetical protein
MSKLVYFSRLCWSLIRLFYCGAAAEDETGRAENRIRIMEYR